MYLYLVTAIICIVIVAIITAVLVCGNLFDGEENGKVISDVSIPKVESKDIDSQEISKDPSQGIVDITEYIEFSVQNDTYSDGNLILIANSEDAIAPNKDKLDLTKIYGKIPNSIYSLSTVELLLNKDAINAFNIMMKDFYDATKVKAISVNSAYTSIESLRKNNTIKTYADLASGRSVRLIAYPAGNGRIGEGVYLWITEHCQNYGYILRYPADKIEQSGVQASASLFRYVGIPHAKYMKENNLSLEEYVESLKNYDYKKPLVYTDFESGKTYHIYYKAKGAGTSTMLNVPTKIDYSISGNNEDGFIVTVLASGVNR